MRYDVKDGRIVEPKVHVKNLKPGLKTDLMVAKALGQVAVAKRGVCYIKHAKYKDQEIVGSTLHKFQPSTNGDHALDTFMSFCRFGDASMYTSECGTRRVVVNEGFHPHRNLAVIEQDGMFHFCNYNMMICYAAINASKELTRLSRMDWLALPLEQRKDMAKERRAFFKKKKDAETEVANA